MKQLTLEITDHIGLLKINRPEVLNCLNSFLLNELQQTLETIIPRHELKALILTGEGKAFIAGADIKEMSHFNSEQIKSFCQLGQHVANTLEKAPFLTIAAINGYALGGGLEMALACDFIYANQNAKIGLPEVTLGLIPGFGGVQRLVRAVGMRPAKELIMSGRIFSAEEALALGIINQIYTSETLIKKSCEMAAQILANPFTAVIAAKNAINHAGDLSLLASLEMEREIFLDCFETSERKNAMNAFINKNN